jgi:hypothetical protein
MSDKGLVDGAVSPEEPSKAEKPGNDQVSITVSMVSRGVTKERGDRHGALNCTQRGDLNGPLTRNKQRGDLYGPLTQMTTKGSRFGLPSNIYTRGDLYGSPTQKDGSRSHPHERWKRKTFKSILLLVWIILVVYIGQTSSANEERGFIIKRQGYVRLDDTHNSTARYKSTDRYIPHSPCAQPDGKPLQTSCSQQCSSHTGHLQFSNSRVTSAKCTIPPGPAVQALDTIL